MSGSTITSILAVGDCNTLGAGEFRNDGYPERLADLTGAAVKNCGFTMSTTREGIHLLEDNLQPGHGLVIIQFGLVDSYATFRYSPYVLYYPDNPWRKQLRSLVKKFKKTCRQSGLNERFGEVEVVPEAEYEQNLLRMVDRCGGRIVILPETIPHHDQKRNGAIQRYNRILERIASTREICLFLPLYQQFAGNMENYYSDNTHANGVGHRFIAGRIADLISGRSQL